MGYCRGGIGIDFETFIKMTLPEIAAATEAYNKKIEHESREPWELGRPQAFYAVAPHLKQGTTPKEFFPLPWDNETAQCAPEKPLTSAERRARIDYLMKLDKNGIDSQN